MKIILETDRVILRCMLPEDVKDMLVLDSDPEVIKYLQPPKPDKAFYKQNIQKQNEFCQNNPGLGAWTAIDKKSGKYIGFFALKPWEKSGEIEISYGITKSFRGKGYGYEVADSLIKYAFQILKIKQILGIAHPENTSSLNILSKLGMEYTHTATNHSLPALFHKIKNVPITQK